MLPPYERRRYLIPFRSQLLPHIFTDTLVIGSGVAGMRASIEAARHGDVILLAKDRIEQSNTSWARGGIAAVHSPDDDFESHIKDTLSAGGGLCDPDIVRAVVEDAPDRIEELIAWGMRFDQDAEGNIQYGREGAHSRHRILHTDGAATGAELSRCLSAKVLQSDSIRVFDRCFALDLLTTERNGGHHGEHVLGAITHHPKYGLQIIWARTTILASGGAARVFRETSNARTATGDGLAMAYRAGAEVSDLEFFQFHPTTLYVAGAGRMLISEAVRGEGAHLLNQEGERFMPAYHELAELAPRDVVSRAIVDQLARSQAEAVFLDVRHVGGERFSQRFPGLTKELKTYDLDPARDLIPVHPSAHYMIGGVRADLDCRTSMPGLLACGEVAANGLHGANRLASNSLLEGLVFGRRAGMTAAQLHANSGGPIRIVSDIPLHDHAELDLTDVGSSLRSAMWRNVGIERDGGRLDDVLDMFTFWGRYTMDMVFEKPRGWEIQNLLTIGALVTQAARWRCESRGVHARRDFPKPSDEYAVHASWRLGRSEPNIHALTASAESSG
jgi:L-aspartate oxidase